jgi:uncharacterized protein YjbJ (UPF0337 family)
MDTLRVAPGFAARPESNRQECERSMGTDDKFDNKVEDLRGKAKEAVGKATGDDSLEAQGDRDQRKSDLKQAGEKVKDAFKKD